MARLALHLSAAKEKLVSISAISRPLLAADPCPDTPEKPEYVYAPSRPFSGLAKEAPSPD
jgi:hypothetical protein